jgi:prepilin-type N-terminal cleavage/methylation domain-containing protein
MNRLSPNRRPLARSRGGFTLIELLTVMIIIGLLVALLLPAISAAVKSARNAAVSAEVNLLAQALESFKSKYGDYPPSRILLCESGSYAPYIGSNSPLTANTPPLDPTSPTANDINVGQLAQRSLAAMRKFFPRVIFTTSGNPPLFNQNKYWYDYNGNGLYDGDYVLHGHECLVFFLGGIPSPSVLPATGSVFAVGSTFGMSGFGKDPTNPFSNNIPASFMYSANRQQPFFEFNAGRLFLDPNGLSGIPGYYDSLSADPPTGSNLSINFYAYFSAYGNGAYDANDVNFSFESDPSGNSPIALTFQHGTATYLSPSPNPYTSTLSTTATTTGTSTGTSIVTFQKAQTYQIISSGVDGLYGIGGQYIAPGSNAASNQNPLPVDANGDTFSAGTAVTGGNIRSGEKDNLTNFKSGTLN